MAIKHMLQIKMVILFKWARVVSSAAHYFAIYEAALSEGVVDHH